MLSLIRDQCSPAGSLGYIDLPSGIPPEHQTYRIYTLERPWISQLPGTFWTSDDPEWIQPPCGRKGVSCIPPGVYDLVPHSTDAHPDTFALVNPDLWVYHFEQDVPRYQRGIARTAVLIHPANYVEELRGCIAPGMSRTSTTKKAVWESRHAFALLRPFLKDAKQLEIVQP